MGTHHFTRVSVEHFLVRSAPNAAYLIGRWLVSIELPYSMFPNRTTQVCVVDDFGNLVAVPA